MENRRAEGSTNGVRASSRVRAEREDEIPGARAERIHKLKQTRSAFKSSLTRKLNELEHLMSSINELIDPIEVRDRISQLFESMKNFKASHDAYHVNLVNEHDIQESCRYYQQQEERVHIVNGQFENWLANAELRARAALLEVTSEDSISNVSFRRKSKGSSVSCGSSTASKRSLASSAASGRLKAAARRAALEAKAASLKSLQDLQREEFNLKQRKRELIIKTEIAGAKAEERVFFEAETLQRDGNESPLDPPVNVNTPLDQPQQLMSISRFLSQGESNYITTSFDSDKFQSVRELAPGGGGEQSDKGVQVSALPNASHIGLPEVQPDKISSDEVKCEGGVFGEPHLVGSNDSTSRYLVDLQRQQQQQNERFLSMQQQQNSQVQMLLEQQQQYTLALTLPQPSVPIFRGDPSDYCSFIRAFENLIEAKTSSHSARLYYLVQYTEGDVQELMQSCLLMKADEGYKEARRLLKAKYGQNHKIAAAYLNKVVDGPVVKPGDGTGLHKFAVTLTSCKNTLKDIGLLNKIENPGIMQKIVGRLPLGLKLKWRDVADKISEEVKREITIEDLAEFVEKRARAATHPIFGNISDPKSSNHNPGKTRFGTKPHKAFASQANEVTSSNDAMSSNGHSVVNLASLGSKPACPMCKNLHWLSQCDKFKEKSVDDRRSFVRANSLCDNCLVSGHYARSCEKKSFCKVADCKLKHSTFLHPKPQSRVTVTEIETQAQNGCVNVNAGNLIGAGTSVPLRSTVSMAIVPVKVRAKGLGELIETYAFLDSGSNTTFCTDLLKKQLGVRGVDISLSLTTMERSNSTRKCTALSLEVFDLDENESVELPVVFSMCSLPVTSKDIPLQEDVDKWKHLEGIHLPSIQAQVGLLIGCDVPKALEPREFKKSKDGGPFATRTMFGWVINGPRSANEKSIVRSANLFRTDAQLSKQFEQFCNMEFNDSVFDDSTSMSREDIRALEIFEKSINLSEGHYNVAIPWSCSPPNLPNNKSMALHRLKYLKKKLSNNPEIGRKYSAFMDELLEKGFARKVPENQIDRDDGSVWYLPHHSVVHPQKPDKTRVVFDCAAKFKGVSLNDRVLQGPDLTNSLVGVLTRFRKESVAFMADIESMFFQVRVPPSDIDALRFLWYPNNDLNQEPVEYQMLVHLFGGVWSPSCANFALLKTAQDNSHLYDTEAVEIVRKNFYVDDCLKSVNSEERAIELIGQLRHMLAAGGFNLTKWVSNSRIVLESIPASERVKEVKDLDLHNDILPVERALGVRWNTETDQFTFKIVVKEKPATRRGLLSIVSSVYDPLGFASPFVLPAKFILQELCRRKLDWDDKIPDELLVRWEQWLSELPALEQFTVDRCFIPPEFREVVRRELHHFSDASELGYGAVSYLRSVDVEGRVNCSFVQAKSRLAPMKQVTIPRLELAAAVVSSRLDRMIRKELDLDISDSVFWTDSTCVLGYINNEDRRFQTYVANRVSTILEASKPSQWKYVDTKSNPADDTSRGLTSESLVYNSRWKYGPQFLVQPESAWPVQPAGVEKISENDSELKKEASSFTTSSLETSFSITSLFQQFSSWYRLRKFVAWMLRLRAGLRALVAERTEKSEKLACKKDSKPISVEELNRAEVAILKCVQRETFEECPGPDDAVKGKVIKRSSPIYGLDPVYINGLLCVGGRLKHAPIQDDAKHPVILPKKHHVVDLIVRHNHAIAGHSGVEYVLSIIRNKFWIVKARVVVKKILRECFDCRRRQAPVGQQRMADLPKDRVTPNKPPFSFVGVDCFGPFIVRRGRSDVKRYGVLFTCLAIRAVHIEVAHSMDTDSFINALRRFISRRGAPVRIRSDNGSNFVSGERELKEAINQWNQEQIHEYLLQQNVEWVFNPPAGSHHGGVWERCIRTVRKIIRAVVREQTLDDESLSTLFCEVESIVNGRPITKASDDPRDMEALTPNHLLLLRSGAMLAPGSFCREDVYSRKRWKQVQYLADVFWRRWTREYLPTLQQRQKWITPRRNFMVNDVVLVVDDTSPRGSWPLARILETHRNSKDGYVRSVTVKTRTSTLHRPVDKIVLLEAADYHVP